MNAIPVSARRPVINAFYSTGRSPLLLLVLMYFAGTGFFVAIGAVAWMFRVSSASMAFQLFLGGLIGLAFMRTGFLLWRETRRGAIWGWASLLALVVFNRGHLTAGDAITFAALSIFLAVLWRQDLAAPRI